MNIQSRLKGAAAPIALSVALLAQPAFAQNETATDEEASDSSDGAPIIVTGSRIRRDEFSAPAPITVVDPEIAVRSGLMNTSEMVQGSPIAAGSSQITAAISSQFVENGGTGVETISLRGLGAERTLVLLNGRRAGPAGTRGAVSAFDLNVLPQSIVEQVDILKDGASSIYGSDAVAGVVNLITKTDTDGIEVDLFGSAPWESGAETWSASATWGTTFDRGHIMLSANYFRRNELSRGDRDYLGCPEAYVFTDESYTARADLVDPRTGEISCNGFESDVTWGHVWTYDGSAFGTIDGTTNLQGSDGVFDVSLIQFDYAGDNLGMYIPGIPTPQSAGHIGTPPGWYVVGYDPASQSVVNNYHPWMDNDTVIPATDRYTLYMDAAYELSDSIEIYTELLYNKRKTYVNASRQLWGFGYGETFDYVYDYDSDGIVDPGDNIYIPGDPFSPGWSGFAVFSPTSFTDQFDNSQEVDYYRGVLGLRGSIGSNWQWDLYGQYSKSDGEYRNQQTLTDSINYTYYRSASCAGITTAVGGKQCVDIDIFDPTGFLYGNLTDAEKDFFFSWDVGDTQYTQWYVEAIVTGDLFELPAGTVGVALGATFRNDEIVDTPGAAVLAGNAWGVTTSGVTAGDTNTLEAFGEISIPLLADIPGIQRLDFTGAARVTNVKATRTADGVTDEDNGNWTYKLGLDWEVTDWLRFRGTYGTSFRAPALFEQFLADQTSSLAQRTIDPCIQWGLNLDQGNISQQLADGCAADGVPDNHTGAGISATIYTGGGLGVLEPETSTAWTASMILTPYLDFMPDTDISIAVDYFDIEVNGEIAQFGPGSIIAGCYTSDFGPSDPLCSLFARIDDIPTSDPDWNAGNPSNVARVRDSFININSQVNRGVDLTVRAVHDFGGDTTLTLQGQMTWQTKDEIAVFDGFPESLNNELGEPAWVGDFSAQVDHGPWSIFYGLDVIGATGDGDVQDWLDANGSLCRSYTTYPNPVCLKLTADAAFYHNISVTREFGDNIRVTAGVSNIFDTTPPRVSNVGGNGITDFGKGVLYSQYDLLGTRAFLNLNVTY